MDKNRSIERPDDVLGNASQGGGNPFLAPYGARLGLGGCKFSVYSRSAQGMALLLYRDVDDREPMERIEFDPQSDRCGDVWSRWVPGITAGALYHYQAEGPYSPEKGQWFDSKARLIDPYADALAGDFLPSRDGILRPPKCVVIDHSFDWRGDQPPGYSMRDTVLYELHVAGFTKSPSSRTSRPGTYLGLIEKIPYLQSLGITAVEFMPVNEFPIRHFHGEVMKNANYWGYDPMAFLSPHRGYAFGKTPGSQVMEFKELVRALHGAGIEVILDVVLNHTCEGAERGPVLSMKGLENSVYYMLTEHGSHFSNFTGCGNTLNCNHPVCRELICHCLRHWVIHYHVDGFRFDLASVLSRDRYGRLVQNAPIIEWIAEDPVLAKTKLIAEAWDAAGAYQVGSFGTGHGEPSVSRRWHEWNGRYRDDVRRFWRGDPHTLGAFATRLCGSSDLYESHGRAPTNSINFITAHDGFTLNDLVSYRAKHNEANGEENRDGENNNYSENFGVEGPATKKTVERKRLRQIKNFLATLMLSQGVPMLSMGDEVRRTQGGNNNAYCQDNEVSWMDWDLVERNAGLLRFVQGMIQLRRSQSSLRRTQFFSGDFREDRGGPDIGWYDLNGTDLDWSRPAEGFLCWLTAIGGDIETKENRLANRDLLLFFNPSTRNVPLTYPELVHRREWRIYCDTSKQSPEDIYPLGDGPKITLGREKKLMNRSMMVWIAEN